MKTLPFAITDKLQAFYMRMGEKIQFEDTQVIGIFFGQVGSGKSIRAGEAAYIISGMRDIKQIAFNKDSFVKAVLISEKEAIIGDEGISLFFSRGAMSKEGRLIAELMAQCRQRNLAIFICIPDILSVDSMILKMATFAVDVWESRKKISGRMVTMKGNMRLWPRFKNNDFLERLIQYLRYRKAQPLKFALMPAPYLMEAGSPYGKGFKDAFYCTDKDKYLALKNGILEKYQKSFERKKPNRSIDYSLMDKMLKLKVSHKKICELLNVSLRAVTNRASGQHEKRILCRVTRG